MVPREPRAAAQAPRSPAQATSTDQEDEEYRPRRHLLGAGVTLAVVLTLQVEEGPAPARPGAVPR